MKFKEVVKQYRASKAFRALADTSKRQYEDALLKAIDLYGEKDVTTIRRADLLQTMEDMSHTPAMANRFARVVSVVFSYALDRDWVQGNPASRLKKHRIGTWSKWYPQEVQAVIALGDRVVSTATALAWYTGQREGDVLNMRWTDIDGDCIRVTPQKVDKGQEEAMRIEMHPDLKAYLATIPRTGPYICFEDKPMSGSAFRGMFKRIINKAGVDKTFHGIRKGVGAFLAESGASTHQIKAFLNHKTLRMAEHYTEEAEGTRLISAAVRMMPELSQRRV